ncbi:MAG TPA: hypothetical protein VF820_02580 [Patescibacteria group bacterium]
MMSLLLISNDQQKAREYAKNLFLAKGINNVDIAIVDSENAIGIEDIRTIQKNLYLKPLKSLEKVLIIPNIQTASTEAQNSLLKVLEEPPANTTIVLLATTEKLLLPTILSRCKIEILDNKQEITAERTDEIAKEFEKIANAPIGEKLAIAQKLAEDKTEAINFLTTAITIARDQMIQDVKNNKSAIKKAGEINKLQKALTLASTTNVAMRMILEDLFLNI